MEDSKTQKCQAYESVMIWWLNACLRQITTSVWCGLAVISLWHLENVTQAKDNLEQPSAGLLFTKSEIDAQ